MMASSVTYNVMLGTALLGAISGVIGTFAVLRRRALVGDMLSHAALPGICIAFLILGSRDLVGLSIGALASGLVGIAIMILIRRWTRTKEDAAIGIVLSTFFGSGIVLLSIIQQHPSGNQAGLGSYLFGETAGITRHDIALIAGVAALCLVVVVLLYKEFELLSFDPEFAAAQGWPTLALDLVMMGTLAVVTVVGLPICGVILIAALIILPGAAARFWSNRLGHVLTLAALAGAGAGIVGTFIASPLTKRWFGVDWFDASKVPPGPLIVLSAAAFFLFSLLVAPQQGIIARIIAELRLRYRMSVEHLLRALYELSEPQLPRLPFIEQSQIRSHRHWREWLFDWSLRRLSNRGLIERDNGKIQLTPTGLTAAAEVTRAHRLWELFLVTNAGIASDHVDRDADDVEHMLSEPLIRELEARLAHDGRLPLAPQHIPESPHELP
jgi:manganese/zinc/iron transport system permease protein